MPAIRNLDGLGCPLARAVGISAGPVAYDDLDRGMALQPCRQGSARAVGQQINPAPALQIAQDGAVMTALAPSPVIDAEHPRLGGRLRGVLAQAAQQGCRTDRHPDPAG